MYVIRRTDTQSYYSSNKNCHWTGDIADAVKFKNRETADKFSKTSLKIEYTFLELINLDAEKSFDESVPVEEMTAEDAEAAYAELQWAAEIFGKAAMKIPSLMAYYQNVHKEEDKRQEDLLHKIEFAPANNLILVRCSRMLKNCREKRRIAKDRISYMSLIKNAPVSKILSTHETYNKNMETRTYTPRIANELFEKGE